MSFNIVLFRNLREWEKTEAIETLIEDSTPRPGSPRSFCS